MALFFVRIPIVADRKNGEHEDSNIEYQHGGIG